MDGATKFVRGDAIAAIIIVVINILGGFVVGMLDGNMTWQDVLRTFTLLTIGMGLAVQIPALLVSLATGLLVTRSAAESNLGQDVTGQIFSKALPLAIAAMVLSLMALAFHNWASIPMLFLALVAVFVYFTLNRGEKAAAAKDAQEAAKPKAREPENVAKLLAVDPMELEIGFGLIPLVDEAQGGDLLDRITMIRRQVALDLGLVVPPIRIRDNMQLGAEAYSVKIRGTEVARGLLMANRFLAINSTGSKDTLPGTPPRSPPSACRPCGSRREPSPRPSERATRWWTCPAWWPPTSPRSCGPTPRNCSPARTCSAWWTTTARATRPWSRSSSPACLAWATCRRSCRTCLRERIPIRDLGSILESLADHARSTKDSDALTEFARQALFRVVTKQFVAADGAIHAVTLDPRLEQTLLNSVTRTETGNFLALDPKVAQKVLLSLSRQIENLNKKGHAPLVLCSPMVRPYFKRLLDKVLPNLTVISYNELDPKVEIQSAGSVKTGDEEQA